MIKQRLAPHFGLFLGSEGIEINYIKAFIGLPGGEVSFYFAEGEMGSYLYRDIPCSTMKTVECLTALGSDLFGIIHLADEIFGQWVAFQSCETDVASACFSLQQSQKSVETCSETDLKYMRCSSRTLFQSHVDKDMF